MVDEVKADSRERKRKKERERDEWWMAM